MCTGICRMVWECPSCGKIYGGIVEGGVVKLCEWCTHRGVCDVAKRDDIPQAERLCQNSDCILAQVLDGYVHAKI